MLEKPLAPLPLSLGQSCDGRSAPWPPFLGQEDVGDELAGNLVGSPAIKLFGEAVPIEDLTEAIGSDDRLLDGAKQHHEEAQAFFDRNRCSTARSVRIKHFVQ